MMPTEKDFDAVQATADMVPEDNEKPTQSDRCVRFDPVPQTIYGRFTMTEEEKALMWWDNEIKRQAKQDVRRCRERVPKDGETSFVEQFRNALSVCNSENRLDAVPCLTSGPERGLEQFLVPEIAEIRKRNIRMLVGAQKKFPARASRNKRAQLLAAVAKKLSKPSRRLARVKAHGDIQEVIGQCLKYLR